MISFLLLRTTTRHVVSMVLPMENCCVGLLYKEHEASVFSLLLVDFCCNISQRCITIESDPDTTLASLVWYGIHNCSCCEIAFGETIGG